MAHEFTSIDNLMLFKNAAWHGLGVVIHEEMTAKEAGKQNGMFWPVEQWQLEAIGPKGERIRCKDHVANMRIDVQNGKDIKHLLGIVGVDYQVCQNQELAEFTDALAQTGKVVIESCGSIRGGERVWFLARGDSFNIGKTDQVYPYVLVSNGHDGGLAIRVTPTTVRVVCSNTLHMVIPRTDGASCETAAIAIRHTGKIMDKLEQAKRAMNYYGLRLRQNQELFEALQAKKIEEQQAMQLFADEYSKFWEVATDEEIRKLEGRERKTMLNRQERMQMASRDFMKRYKDERAELQCGDTAWLAMNAMTGYLQHDRPWGGTDTNERWQNQVEQNVFGINSVRSQDVLNYALAM